MCDAVGTRPNTMQLPILSPRRQNRNLAASALLLPFVLHMPAVAADWPQYRGPHASGVSAGTLAPTQWDVTKNENIRWKTSLPGLAHSSPLVWGERVYVATAVRPGEAELKVGLYGDIASVAEAEKHQWRLLVLEKGSGKVAWDTLAVEAVPRVQRHPKSSHCNSTPAPHHLESTESSKVRGTCSSS